MWKAVTPLVGSVHDNAEVVQWILNGAFSVPIVNVAFLFDLVNVFSVLASQCLLHRVIFRFFALVAIRDTFITFGKRDVFAAYNVLHLFFGIPNLGEVGVGWEAVELSYAALFQ